MKITKILTFQLILLWLAGSIPLSYAQDSLNQLNDQNNQGVIQQTQAAAAAAATAKAVNDDKIRATMSSDEFKSFSESQAYVDQNSNYTLGPDDIIDIVVMRHPEVSGQYTINKEGKIQYEFAGDVTLAGLTKEQAVAALSKKLSVYIIKPEISFKITGYNSKIVYVVGEVARPGRIPMHGDTITVRDALLEAGLPLIGSAATDSASIFTPDASGKVVRKKVNVEALLYRGDLRENYILHPGDCLYVPATFLTKAMRVIEPVTTPVAQVAGSGAAVAAF
jgi:protein involved in polysaccharide export with SLBB domain